MAEWFYCFRTKYMYKDSGLLMFSEIGKQPETKILPYTVLKPGSVSIDCDVHHMQTLEESLEDVVQAFPKYLAQKLVQEGANQLSALFIVMLKSCK